jgi:hypothetical protein
MNLFIPTREYIDGLKVGDTALDCFGRLREVVEIVARKDDIDGRRFVMYYTSFGPGSTCSMSQKEGKLTRHAGIPYKSAKQDEIERMMLRGERFTDICAMCGEDVVTDPRPRHAC